jgi:uncharacterized protein YqjF (DUF2071 family)
MIGLMPSSASRFLTARWVDLAMVNYEVDPALLRALVPAGTELDLWSGRCLVSVVGFQFLETRVLGLAMPFHRHFEEVNLRFYVRRTVDGEVRRGVVFVKEIVPRRAIAWIAKAVYNEKYIALATSHGDATIDGRRTLSYGWRFQGAWCRLAVTLEGGSFVPADDSEEAFVTEHYWGYTTQRDGSTLEYKVEHPRWNVWKGSDPELICDTAALYGPAFGSFLSGPPTSCFVADGSAVIVRRGVPVR